MCKPALPVWACVIRAGVILLLPVIALVGACGGSEGRMPTQPTTASPLPQPPAPAPVPAPTGLPSLAACSVWPNYVGERDSDGVMGELYRRERFPLRVSIASGGDNDAYREAIEKGLAVWALATGGVIGAVDIRTDWSDADLTVQVGPHPVYDCRNPRTRWYGIFVDRQVVAPRIVRGGRIFICPENFNATPSDVLRVAHVVGHEMGHALGIAGHSTHPADLMYEDDVAVNAPAGSYPWVTTRDLNTLGTAYCN